jgi:hypothetical protein
VRTAKRAATPKTIKKARRALSPIDNAMYDVERKLNTKSPKQKRQATRPSRKHGGAYIGAWVEDRGTGMRGRVTELLDDGSVVTIWEDGEMRTARAD